MIENLKEYKIVLASNSPRRKELLKGLEIDFEVITKNIDESYPNSLLAEKVPEYIAQKKADAMKNLLDERTIVITADTVVIVDKEILGKPHDKEDAYKMLSKLSSRTHIVTTGVVISSQRKNVSFSVSTEVTFAPLTSEEIEHYLEVYKPYDKAGSYGIQEWIGYIGIEKINGSYFNVMGLPVQRLYRELIKF
jgi:septum formation protein